MATVTFTRDITPELTNPLTVNFTVGGTATFEVDYTVTGENTFTTTAGSIIIPANQTQANIILIPIVDTFVETDETVILTFVPEAAVSNGDANVTWNIIDDDILTILVYFTSSPLPNIGVASTNSLTTGTGSYNNQTLITSINGMSFIGSN
jgi:hypothetical protein